jgi:hypothetical protein
MRKISFCAAGVALLPDWPGNRDFNPCCCFDVVSGAAVL